MVTILFNLNILVRMVLIPPNRIDAPNAISEYLSLSRTAKNTDTKNDNTANK